ncbi:MAG: hypothetical protein KBD63_01055 [Bacteriovoracaceae bacterium]|nr:hypothetical protein [Bacteriovoracaceae bacterium]
MKSLINKLFAIIIFSCALSSYAQQQITLLKDVSKGSVLYLKALSLKGLIPEMTNDHNPRFIFELENVKNKFCQVVFTIKEPCEIKNLQASLWNVIHLDPAQNPPAKVHVTRMILNENPHNLETIDCFGVETIEDLQAILGTLTISKP